MATDVIFQDESLTEFEGENDSNPRPSTPHGPLTTGEGTSQEPDEYTNLEQHVSLTTIDDTDTQLSEELETVSHTAPYPEKTVKSQRNRAGPDDQPAIQSLQHDISEYGDTHLRRNTVPSIPHSVRFDLFDGGEEQDASPSRTTIRATAFDPPSSDGHRHTYRQVRMRHTRSQSRKSQARNSAPFSRHAEAPSLPSKYRDRVKAMSEVLPDARHVLRVGRQSYEGRIACFDYFTNDHSFSDQIGFNVVQVLERDISAWRPTHSTFSKELTDNMHPACRVRVILMESACVETIELLGDTFSVHPHFFAEHLHSAGYDQSESRSTKDASVIGGLDSKGWPSLRWKKPVQLSGLASGWRKSAVLDGKWTTCACPEPGTCPSPKSHHRLRLESNIVRSWNKLSLHSETSESNIEPLVAWDEQATCWMGQVDSCKFSKCAGYIF